MNEYKKIEEARERVVEWLYDMDAPGEPGGIKRTSKAQDPEKWPGMLLPATYNAWHCLVLLGAEDQPGVSREEVAGFINRHQQKDGFYRIPGMKNGDIYKRDDLEYTWEYINFHVTNYSFGVVDSLGFASGPLRFLAYYLSDEGFGQWKKRRRWDDPWMEGNNVVNLASFFHYENEKGSPVAEQRFQELIEYQRSLQNPQTGYWSDQELEGMAGAAHNYQLYYAENTVPDYPERIIDTSLKVATENLEGVGSACLDIDIVDILVNLSGLGIKVDEIQGYLHRKLVSLLEYQNEDGGFSDEQRGTRTFDGWPGGYREPQGLSNCFATWFRMATIGMISSVLFPETKGQWTFRNTLGMGYLSSHTLPALEDT